MRAPRLNRNLFWSEAASEKAEVYRFARQSLEFQGFNIQGIVLDGRKGIREVFCDIPVQMCHFHQKMILTRYLTTNPRLPAARELRNLAISLAKSTEEEFGYELESWYKKWQQFLKEKTVDFVTERWHYTHRRLRAAYRSLKANLPYLFTYQKFPELKIPNTTNSLDGAFAHLKGLVLIHRGLKSSIKKKLIQEILSK